MEPVIESFEIAYIDIANIRALKKLTLDLRDASAKARKITLIIGKNGTCKSSLLRAIALGLADQTDATKLISEQIGGLISQESQESQIEIELSVTSQPSPSLISTTTLARTGTKEEVRPKYWRNGRQGPGLATLPPEPFVCGYGAGRFGTGNDTGRPYRIADSVATLFRYEEPLISTELTLHRLDSLFGTERYARILKGIKRVLGLSDEDEIELPAGGGVIVHGPTIGNRVPLEAWADGYRLTFSWLLDLYAWAMRKGSIDERGYVEGILLIDEVEQHLHPSMQAEILPRLSELLPKMQIIATTHSPLVALDAKPEELVVLRREGDYVVAEENLPNYTGYSVEDMLTDPRLFETEVYGSETREKLAEYRELVSIPQEERKPEQRTRLRSLSAEIQSFEGPPAQENETTRLLKQLVAKYHL